MTATRKRAMPAAAIELLLGRGLIWPVLVINALIAVGITLAAITGLATGNGSGGDASWSTSARVAFVLFAVWWWALCGDLIVLAAYRPLHTRAGLEEANRDRGQGVIVPGSRRLPATTLGFAVLTLVLLVGSAIAMGGAGGIVLAVLAVGMTAVVIDFGLTLGRPRSLTLSPAGLAVVEFRVSARVDWDDVLELRFVQGMNGAMVFRALMRPDAPSYVETWRHPFARRKGSIDIEPIALDLDPLLLILALQTYLRVPSYRQELAGGTVPARLTDFDEAIATTPSELSQPLVAIYKASGAPK